MKLAEIADKITTHLTRFANDQEKKDTFYNPGAWPAGNRVMVKYVSYQGEWSLTKPEAVAYLARLDAGHVGKHWR